MGAVWADRGAFRAAPSPTPALRPTGRQSIALLAVLVLAAGAIAAASYFIRPDTARSFDVFSGSLYLEDSLAPVAVDLASGKPTVRLVDAYTQVGAKRVADLAVSTTDDGAILLNRRTGEFNMVDSTGFLIKRDGGVPLPELTGATSARAVPSGDLSYIEQSSSTRTSIYLVGPAVVQSAESQPKASPRAFRVMRSPVSPDPNASGSADGDLWVLTGRGDDRTIRRLSVPAGSAPGATLDANDYGTVSGAAAIGTTTGGANSAVGVATDHQIRVFQHGALAGTANFPAQPGVTSILPATNSTDRLSFLMHGRTGWSVVSVGADGSDLRGPIALDGVAASADLVQPAASNGSLYTMDAAGGQFVRIDGKGEAGPIAGLGRYPLAEQNGKVIEPGGFSDAYVIARGSRVIYNSPDHRDALVVFTDGSHAPLRIEKSAAVSVNAAGGADALTRSRLGNPTAKGPKQGRAKPKQQNAPISNKIDCTATTQKPHIPTIVQAQPGSRSVLLAWDYPLLDPQDCEPTTYRVQVTTLTSGGPSAPSAVTVQGQKSVNLGGLSPSTRYGVTVTAFINGQSTPSSQIQVTTGPAGPNAPNGVQAGVDAAGVWTVTWGSCGTDRDGCVPSSTWKVIPQFCDGLGLSDAPSPINVAADPTTTVQPPARINGGSALLGRGIRFQVEGIGEDGTVGTPSPATGCTYSWARPQPGAITVSASTPPAASADSTTATTAVVRYSSTSALGGIGGQLTYRLLDANGSTVSTVGPTTDTSVQLGGISPGGRYRVAVTVTPPRHPEAAVNLATVAVNPTIAAWPRPGAVAQVNYDNTGLADGTLTTSFSLPSGTPTRGETFDLVNSGMDCGNTHLTLDRSGVSPGQSMTFKFSRALYYGNCTVTLQLTQNSATATSPPLFGSTSSPATFPVRLSINPPLPATTASDFDARWAAGAGNPQVTVSYSGPDDLSLGSGWSIVVSNASGDCGSASAAPTVTIGIDRDCVSAGGPFTASVAYRWLGATPSFDNIQVLGSAPEPLDPADVSFDASWTGSAGNPAVDLSYTGNADPTTLGTVNWQEQVVSGGVVCGGTTATPGVGDLQIPVDLSICPPIDSDGKVSSYAVVVHLSDPNYGTTGDYSPTVSGTPPQ